MTTNLTTVSVDELRAELAGIGARVERAAAADDVVGWMEARMRADALPLLVREARTAPLRDRLARVEAEIDAAVEELRRAQDEPYPEVPHHMRGQVSAGQLHQSRLQNIAGRQAEASRDRRRLLAQIADVEAGR